MLPVLENHLTAKFADSDETPVNQARETVRQAYFTLLFDEAIPILTHPENDYDPCTGLKRASAPDNPDAFIL